MDGHYILNVAGDPVLEPDVMRWARWFEGHNQDRVVARTELPGDVIISTVFLGLDHAFGRGEPRLFETMIFGGPLDETQDRYATRQAAINGHRYYVALATEVAQLRRELAEAQAGENRSPRSHQTRQDGPGRAEQR